VILTDARPYQDASDVCAKLGEQLWRPTPGQGHCKRALPFADYLKYDGTADASSTFWVSSGSNASAVDITGRSSNAGPGSHARGLCTNTAPFSTQSSQDTSDKWQISLDVNGQTITGWV
jgi:hypothetical protein